MRIGRFLSAAAAALAVVGMLSCQGDPGSPLGSDEGPAPPNLDGGTLSLDGGSSSAGTGQTQTFTATLRDRSGAAISGVTIYFLVASGPNAGVTGSDVSDAAGQASFTYAGAGGPGRDVIAAATAPIIVDAGGVPHAGDGTSALLGEAEATWVGQDVASGALTLEPLSARHVIGSAHTVTATLRDGTGVVSAGAAIHFRVVHGPNAGAAGLDTTDTQGRASFTYTGNGGAGRDVIAASPAPLLAGEKRLVPALDPAPALRAEAVSVWALVATGAPVAHAGGPYAGAPQQAVAFNGSGSSDPEAGALTYQWSFGDGATGGGATPTHEYAAAGGYSAVLTVTDREGLSDSDTSLVTITAATANASPTASAGGPYAGTAGTPIAFDGGGSSDPEGAPLDFAWSFGDGSTGTGATPSHAYATSGSFQVVLTVTDSAGATDADTATANVAAQPPPQQGVCTTISFDDLGSHGTPVSGFTLGTDDISLAVTPGGARSQAAAFLYDTDLPDAPDFDLKWSGPGARCPGCQGLHNVLVIPDHDFDGEGDSGDGGTYTLTGFTPGEWILAGLTAIDSDESAWNVQVDGVTVAQTVAGANGNVQQLTATANPIVNEVTIQLPLESGAIDALRFCPFEVDPIARTQGIFTVVSGQNGGTVIAGNGLAGIFFPPGWSDVDRLIVSIPLQPPALDTDLPQFPAQFLHQSFPDLPFEEPVIVGHCAIFPDEFTPGQIAALRLAKNIDENDPEQGTVVDGVAVFDAVSVPFALPACVEAQEARRAASDEAPRPSFGKHGPPGGVQLAARTGVGGQVSAFSPFGVVLLEEPTGEEGAITGSVVSAATALPLNGAVVEAFCPTTAQTPTATTTTGSNGRYTFPALPEGDCRLRASAEGFVSAERTATAVGGETNEAGVLALVPIPPQGSDVTIVLTWGPTPSDLDAHLTGPAGETRFHVFFAARGSCTTSPFAQLDVDDTSSFGPETISICEQAPGVYRYSVHDFSNLASTTSRALADSGAEVVVFRGTMEIGRFNPPDQPGTLWTVFELNGNTLTPVNQMSFQSNPILVSGRAVAPGLTTAVYSKAAR